MEKVVFSKKNRDSYLVIEPSQLIGREVYDDSKKIIGTIVSAKYKKGSKDLIEYEIKKQE